MIKLASVLLLAVATHCFYLDDGSNKPVKEKIVGGNYTSIKEVPYLAQILRYKIQVCGGTIISEEWILTAAHCVQDTYRLSVATGSTYRGEGQKHAITKIIIHKHYNSETLDSDIALIKLSKKIKFNEVQRAIAIATKIPQVDDLVKIAGFGKEGENLSSSFTLKSATVPVISQEVCLARYTQANDGITDNMFCAGKGPTDACDGDSGGPAVINGLLSGIVSSGLECGSAIYPGVYTHVYKYREWIASKTELVL